MEFVGIRGLFYHSGVRRFVTGQIPDWRRDFKEVFSEPWTVTCWFPPGACQRSLSGVTVLGWDVGGESLLGFHRVPRDFVSLIVDYVKEHVVDLHV